MIWFFVTAGALALAFLAVAAAVFSLSRGLLGIRADLKALKMATAESKPQKLTRFLSGEPIFWALAALALIGLIGLAYTLNEQN